MADLTPFEDDGQLVVDSRLIAEELGIEHESFMRTIDNNKIVAEQAFGIFRFEIGKIDGRGRPEKYALLTEDQATFLMTLSRNTLEVVQCKVKLVKAFSKAKELLKNSSFQDESKAIPYWYQRTKVALTDAINPLQVGYFCVYLEMMDFFQQMEVRLGYIMPDFNPETEEYLVPDISIASRFNDWLRSNDNEAKIKRRKYLGSEEIVDFRPERFNKDKSTGEQVLMPAGNCANEIKIYNHVYPKVSHGEYNVKPVRSYPKKYLEIFFYYLEEIYISSHFKKYLSARSSDGWKQIEASIRSMTPSQKNSLKGTLVGKLFPLLPPS